MEKILMIDDDPDVRDLVCHALQKEYEVTALPALPQDWETSFGGYDLILLDVMLGQEDGFQVCLKIREAVDCPILFLTARSEEEDMTYGFSVGGDDYIRKPFSIEELRARVGAHLRREKRQHNSVLVRSGVRFYLKQKEAYYQEEKLPFTQSEYEISLLLAKNNRQVFSREEIYEAVYGYEKDGNDSAIAEHVKNIRRKMGDAGLNVIETVWGIGYRWKDDENA